MSRDEQLSKERDEPESRQETARNAGSAEPRGSQTEDGRRQPAEGPAEAEPLKASGEVPPAQDSD